jgi:hypothetical protein
VLVGLLGTWKSNKAMLGKALLRLGRKDEARAALREAMALPVVSKEVREEKSRKGEEKR